MLNGVFCHCQNLQKKPKHVQFVEFSWAGPPGNIQPHGARIEIASSCERADKAIGVALCYLRSLQTAGAVSSLCKMIFLGVSRE